MHELGIVFHVIKTVERVGAENDLTRVAGVTLELGEVCGAIPKELVSCWDWAVQKSDLLRGAQLHIETLPAVTQCGGCGREYPTVAHGRTCPRCGSDVTESKKGFFCEKNDCRFGLWRDNKFFAAKRTALTKKVAAALLAEGRVKLTGLYSEKTGGTYDATAVLEDTGESVRFRLEFDKGART